MSATPTFDSRDEAFMTEAIELARLSQTEGNAPIGAVLAIDGEIVGRGRNQVLHPRYAPMNHAELLAIRSVPRALWVRARELTCYSTLEPCLMCLGALVIHGVGRIVIGARDPEMGAGQLLEALPPWHLRGPGVPDLEGPCLSGECGELSVAYRAVLAAFDPSGA